MDLKLILDLLGKDHGSVDEMTGAFLDDAVATFSTNPAAGTSSIRQLQTSDPSGFALAALRLLATKAEKSPGIQYVAGLLFAGNLLIDPLIDEDSLPLDAAISLACNLATAEPILDARLMRKLLLNAGGDVRAIKASVAQRVLRLVETISDCSRLSSFLIQLMRHPSPEVRSKAALLLGRGNLNMTRVKSFLQSDDGRLRANAVESLWEHAPASVRDVLWEATKDPCGRVFTNALMALCRQGDMQAFERLIHMALSQDPVLRSGAAWAMGKCGNPEFAPTLDKLAGDTDAKVRAMAEKSRAVLRASPSEDEPHSGDNPPSGDKPGGAPPPS